MVAGLPSFLWGRRAGSEDRLLWLGQRTACLPSPALPPPHLPFETPLLPGQLVEKNGDRLCPTCLHCAMGRAGTEEREGLGADLTSPSPFIGPQWEEDLCV